MLLLCELQDRVSRRQYVLLHRNLNSTSIQVALLNHVLHGQHKNVWIS